MTVPPASACITDVSDFPEPSALTHAPLLAPLLVFSLILHAAAIGFWPDAPVMATEPLPAASIAVQLHPNVTGDNHHADTQSTAPARQQPTPVTATRQRHKQAQHTPAAARKISRPVSAARSDTAFSISTLSPVAGRIQTDAAAVADNGAALRRRLNGSLQSALIAHFEYPPIARRRGWEGVVQVSLRVEADGQLSRLRLVATSGHALLDRAALQSLNRVGRLPEVAGWLHGRQMDMILPVRYQLIDS